MQVSAIATVFALALGGCGGGDASRPAGDGTQDPPAADAPLPRDTAALADRLTGTQRSLDRAVDAWRHDGDSSTGPPPTAVTLFALDQQRIHILLSNRAGLARRVLARLPGRIAAHARASIRARHELAPLATPQPRSDWPTGPAPPAGALLRHYREAQRRFGVGWPVLAAVNLVESAFGRMRNTSTAGAQGPMQFIPSTWAAYGMGGNIRDPHDAILGAANYLHSNGAPRDYRAALYHYNPSSHYVDAVLAYADRIRRDSRNYFAYYAWQVFVRTPTGSGASPAPVADSRDGRAHRDIQCARVPLQKERLD